MSKPKNQKPSNEHKAVAYCRVASATQTDQNQSIETQKRLISEAAQKAGIEIVQWYEAVGETSPYQLGRRQRKVLKDAHAYCSTHQVSHLFVTSPDRLSRLSTDYCEWERKFQKVGTVVKAVKRSNDTDPLEAMKDGYTFVSDQFERQLSACKIKQALAAKRRED
jgi:DNA invertase Pin-like site-specific DNA recombinase